MTSLNQLKNTNRPHKARKRVGRGIGSGTGKTCGRGEKGQGSRSGATQRLGYEGGQFRTFMKLPIRGFSNVRFQKRLDCINVSDIEKLYNDGDTVNLETLRERGYIDGKSYGIKILGNGDLTKKVTIEAVQASESAKEKIQKAGATLTLKK
jgi:large subunit ribosomal protein L15